MVWNQQFLVRPAGSFENSISPSYVDETHLGDEHDKFMGINFFDGHGPDFMRPRHSPIRRWFLVSTPSICWFQMMWFVPSRLRLYLGMGLSWLVWTWVTLNCNAFSLFLSSQFPLVDNPIFWQTQSPVGIPFPPHLLSRQSRWGFGKMSDDFAVVRSIIEDRCLVLWKIVTSPTFSVLLHVKLTRLRKKWPADSCRF